MALKKLAVVSHIFPPMPSGQSMVLSYMLRPLPPEQYELICTRDYSHADLSRAAFPPLPAPLHTTTTITDADIESLPILRFLRPVDPDKPTLSRRLLRPFWKFYGYARRKFKALLAQVFIVRQRAREIQAIVQQTGCQAIMACTGDLYDLPAAYLASRWLKIPFLVYIMDDYKYHGQGMMRRIAAIIQQWFMRGADGTIVLNEYVQREYRRRYGKDSTVIHIPTRLPDLDALDSQPPLLDTNTVNIVYTGAVYHAHYDAFRNMVEAIQRMERDDVRLHVFTGQPSEALTDNGIAGDHVIHHNHIPHEDVIRVLREADIAFLPLAFHSDIDELLENTSPSKMGEYLAAGGTILVHAPRNYFLTDYFKNNDCGIVVDELNPDVLAAAIGDILQDDDRRRKLNHNARQQAAADFDVSRLQERFGDFLGQHL